MWSSKLNMLLVAAFAFIILICIYFAKNDTLLMSDKCFQLPHQFNHMNRSMLQGLYNETQPLNYSGIFYFENICLKSTVECLHYIAQETGITPLLLSYPNTQSNYNNHPVTGQKLLVPNVIHYIRYGEDYLFDFPSYVSYKSVQAFVKPDLILIWGDYLPPSNSTWWRRTVNEIANLYFIKVDRIMTIGGKKVKFTEHESDWLRLKIIKGT